MTGVGLLLLIFIIFVLNGRFVMSNYSLLTNILIPAVSFSLLLLAGSSLLAAVCRSDYGDSVGFTISVTLKNTAVSMALATTVFQDMTALAIAITGPLVQLPVMLSYLKIRTWSSGWDFERSIKQMQAISIQNKSRIQWWRLSHHTWTLGWKYCDSHRGGDWHSRAEWNALVDYPLRQGVLEKKRKISFRLSAKITLLLDVT